MTDFKSKRYQLLFLAILLSILFFTISSRDKGKTGDPYVSDVIRANAEAVSVAEADSAADADSTTEVDSVAKGGLKTEKNSIADVRSALKVEPEELICGNFTYRISKLNRTVGKYGKMKYSTRWFNGFVNSKKEQIASASKRAYKNLIESGQIRDVPFSLYRLADQDFQKIPLNFSSDFKNPCWYHGRTTRCLPYFYLIGMPKCGTTDTFSKLTKHPQIVYGHGRRSKKLKGASYWTKAFGGNNSAISPADYYEGFPKNLLSDFKMYPQHRKTHVMGDMSPSYMWNFFDEQFLIDGSGFGLPDILRAVQPDAKFIVALRDPISRAISDYRNFHSFEDVKSGGSALLHDMVTNTIQEYHECVADRKSEIGCMGFEGLGGNLVRLTLGLYHVLFEKWFSVFPREQFFIYRLEDRYKDCAGWFREVASFLEIDELSESETASICGEKPRRQTGGDDNLVVEDETKQMLKCFYQPYNKKLADLLGDKRYLWSSG